MTGRRIAAIAVVLTGAFASTPAAADHSILELTSTGPAVQGNQHSAGAWSASEDGRHVLFRSESRLTADDTDTTSDVYMRFNGTTTLFDALVDDTRLSLDGNIVAITSSQQLVPEDVDSQEDVYRWQNGSFTLVSTGPVGGNGPYFAGRPWISDDGSHIVFLTTERLVPGDLDNTRDLYVRSGNTTELVSTGPAGGNSGVEPDDIALMSDHGAGVFFRTAESLVSADTDSSIDLYERTGGTTTLLSTGSSGGNGAQDVTQGVGVSRTGGAAFFMSAESLVPGDTDNQQDVYRGSGAGATLVSTGPSGGNGAFPAYKDIFSGVPDDGQSVFFYTQESLVPADTDNASDGYRWSNGTTELITTGPTGGNGPYGTLVQRGGYSSDGSVAVFATPESLVPEDTNGESDLYVREGGSTALVSGPEIGPGAACGEDQTCPDLLSISADGRHIFFLSPHELVPGATSGGLYEFFDGRIYYLPVTDPNGVGVFLTSGVSSADGSRFVFDTYKSLLSSDANTAPDIYTLSEGTGYPRPKGASPLQIFLVPAYSPCAAPNRTHGSPLAFPSCSPPSQASSRLTVGSPDANGAGAKSVAKVFYAVRPADVALTVTISDVRNKAGFSDYTGELSLVSSLQITDRNNTPNPGGPGPGSGQATSLPVTVPCTATGDSTVGSNCNLQTTINSLYPGAVSAGQRAVWEVGQVKAYDGGADGLASTTGDNTLFLTQGIFIP